MNNTFIDNIDDNSKSNNIEYSFLKNENVRIIAIANQKGGVGKTTTAVNLAASLSEYGKRVLLIDLDPQANASISFGIRCDYNQTESVYDVLLNQTSIVEAMHPVKELSGNGQLYCLPSTKRLVELEFNLISASAREFRLKRAINEFCNEFEIDYIIVDAPPSLGILTLNALTAVREIIVPVQCEYYALEGLEQLTQTVRTVAKCLNPYLIISNILLTMWDGRTSLSKEITYEVKRFFKTKVLSTVIPRVIALAEAPSHQQSIISYQITSRGSYAYLSMAEELIAQEELV